MKNRRISFKKKQILTDMATLRVAWTKLYRLESLPQTELFCLINVLKEKHTQLRKELHRLREEELSDGNCYSEQR